MTHKIATRMILATTLCQASALAQVRFCIGGALDTLSPAQKSSCSTKLQTVRRLAAALHAPDNWHFVLVCGEEGWKDYSTYSKGAADALASRAAETNIERHETFLRETKLDTTELLSSRGIIAYEVAAAVLRSKDEIAIRDEVARRSFTLAASEGQ